ncbi:sulfatase [Oceaniferula spumae]|uniref:Sulfatase n=1 Tax=Oceaniferula spumae TaxID=2979115 RepID=A0AAT9FLZ0_9BACT
MLKKIFLLLTLSTPILTAAEKPNILFFFVDDMGWQDTSVPFHTEVTQLNKDYRTPNMEKLAENGLMFTNAYACSICSPSRISLMTGQNAARHKVTCWTLRKNVSPERGNKNFSPPEWPFNGLQPIGANVERTTEATTLPEILRKNGYRTIHAGKAHFGAKDTPGADPSNLGFDVNIAGSYMGGPGSYHGDKNFSAKWRGGGTVWDIPGLEKYHGQKINLTEAITREAISAIEKSVAEKKPFYLYMSHYAVHAPFEPDRRFLPNYNNEKWNNHKKKYASMIESMDKSLGDLLTTIDRLGIAKNTIVIFMSDNGSPRENPRNLPLRAHKISGYEGGTRVPLIIHHNSLTKPKTRTNTPVIIEDIFPTILEMAGVKEIPKSDGLSMNPILDNTELDRSKRPLIWHYPNLYDMPPHSAIRVGDLKLIYWHTNQKIELFDLKNDIGEKQDLAAKRPEVVSRLAKQLSDDLRSKKALMLTNKKTKQPVPMPDKALSR